MKKLVLALIFLLQGCSALATKEAAIGCQVADIATTARALHFGAAELNPVPIPILYALKLGIIWYIWRSPTWNTESETTRAAVTIIGCAPVLGNLKAAKDSVR